MSDEDEEKVGYGRPPRGRRWQKGESGNPAGRPKRTVSATCRYVMKALEMPVTINMGGVATEVTAREAIVKLRLQAAMQGDPNAANDLMLLERREVKSRRSRGMRLIVEYVEPHISEELRQELRRYGQEV